MPFWSENFGENASLNDPKRNFRFSVEFQGIQAAQGGAKLWYAKSCGKPSFAINATFAKLRKIPCSNTPGILEISFANFDKSSYLNSQSKT